MNKQLSIKDFLKRYGTNTTTNFDLIKMAKDLNIPNFHVCMTDEVSSLKLLKSFNAVVNLHTSDEIGIHWSCFTPSYFFDSFRTTSNK